MKFTDLVFLPEQSVVQ